MDTARQIVSCESCVKKVVRKNNLYVVPPLWIFDCGGDRSRSPAESAPVDRLDGRTHLAPVAYPPADTRSVDVARSHCGWSRLVYTAISGDRCTEHCRDALFTLDRTGLLAAVAARRTVAPFRRVPPAPNKRTVCLETPCQTV